MLETLQAALGRKGTLGSPWLPPVLCVEEYLGLHGCGINERWHQVQLCFILFAAISHSHGLREKGEGSLWAFQRLVFIAWEGSLPLYPDSAKITRASLKAGSSVVSLERQGRGRPSTWLVSTEWVSSKGRRLCLPPLCST